METRELTGAEAIVQGLLAHDIDTVFALPGAQIYGLIDALAKSSDRIRTIGARHEQACAYMAFGYARASGKPGVFAVVPGPGILNASAALLTANSCNARVLGLTGDIPSPLRGRERGALHELRDQLAILRSLTKWADQVEHPSQASLFVARAFQEMSSGRQGATALQAAWDYFFRGGRGVVSNDHPLGLTIAAAQRLWPKTDVAIVIGSRFELMDIRWRHRPPGLKIIRVDIDPAELRRLPSAVGIVGDAAAAIRSVQPQVDYLKVIRDVLPRNGFFVEEISQMGFAAMFGFPVYEPRTHFQLSVT